MFAKRRKSVLPALVAAAVVVAGVTGYLVLRDEDAPPAGPERFNLVRACDLPLPVLERVARGYYPKRSGDVLAIERLPNQFGTRHSTPFAYTQDVPLVLYGPGYIKKGVTVKRNVTVADLTPTYAELLGFDIPERQGAVLNEALLSLPDRLEPPKIIFTLVWDGGGDNMLQNWPDSWPVLKNMMNNGVKFTRATVGSSPSITPAVHATIGSGNFPNKHGLVDITMRTGGRLRDAWDGSSPKYFETNTLADLWDKANDNKPKVAMVARDNWHLGMIGHGSAITGADKDIAVMDRVEGTDFRTAKQFFTLPDYVLGRPGFAEDVDKLDRRDGQADGKWLGNELDMSEDIIRKTPAWPPFQTRIIGRILRRANFGADAVTDLFYANYKPTDLAGHQWNLVEPETRDNLRAQDKEIGKLIEILNEVAGPNRYLLALTADHGMTPYPAVTGGYSISPTELQNDVNRRFDKNGGKRLMYATRGYSFYLNKDDMRDNDVTAVDIAAFIRNYRLKDNIPDGRDIPKEFENRVDERIYLSAFTPGQMHNALECARSRLAENGSASPSQQALTGRS